MLRARRRTRRRPFLAMLKQEQLRRVGAHGHLARDPALIVQIHVRVVLDVTAEGTIEVPEPVRAELMPSRTPKRLIAFGDKARAGLHELRRAAQVKSEVLDALHEGRRLDQEQGVMISTARRLQKRTDALEPIGAAKPQPRVKSFRL